jgi:alpha-N-arabinofuranosidase
VNTADAPLTVAPAINTQVVVDGEKITARLKPGSWNVIVTTAATRS